MIQLVQRTLHLTGEEGHGAHDEGDDGAGDVDGGMPMMARERGMTQVSRMIKGMERKKFTSLSST